MLINALQVDNGLFRIAGKQAGGAESEQRIDPIGLQGQRGLIEFDNPFPIGRALRMFGIRARVEQRIGQLNPRPNIVSIEFHRTRSMCLRFANLAARSTDDRLPNMGTRVLVIGYQHRVKQLGCVREVPVGTGDTKLKGNIRRVHAAVRRDS